MNRYLLAIAAGAILTLPVQAGQYTEQVKAQLIAIKMVGLSEGWEETHNDRFDSMGEGSSDSFSFTLRKGLSYKVFAVCDEDCSDLDLTLYDENQRVIAKDNSSDSMPVVGVTPSWSGRFSLGVRMYSCGSDICFYGISIIGK